MSGFWQIRRSGHIRPTFPQGSSQFSSGRGTAPPQKVHPLAHLSLCLTPGGLLVRLDSCFVTEIISNLWAQNPNPRIPKSPGLRCLMETTQTFQVGRSPRSPLDQVPSLTSEEAEAKERRESARSHHAWHQEGTESWSSYQSSMFAPPFDLATS